MQGQTTEQRLLVLHHLVWIVPGLFKLSFVCSNTLRGNTTLLLTQGCLLSQVSQANLILLYTQSTLSLSTTQGTLDRKSTRLNSSH